MPKIALQKQRWCVEVVSKANNREVEAAGSGGFAWWARGPIYFWCWWCFLWKGSVPSAPLTWVVFLNLPQSERTKFPNSSLSSWRKQLEHQSVLGFCPVQPSVSALTVTHRAPVCPPPALQLSTYGNEVPRRKEKRAEKRDPACLPAEKGESLSSLPRLMLSMSSICDPCYRENQNQRSNIRKTLLFCHCSVTVSQAWVFMVWLCTVVAEVFKMFKVLLGAGGVG